MLKDFRLESYRLEGDYVSEPLLGLSSHEREAAAGVWSVTVSATQSTSANPNHPDVQ